MLVLVPRVVTMQQMERGEHATDGSGATKFLRVSSLATVSLCLNALVHLGSYVSIDLFVHRG